MQILEAKQSHNHQIYLSPDNGTFWDPSNTEGAVELDNTWQELKKHEFRSKT